MQTTLALALVFALASAGAPVDDIAALGLRSSSNGHKNPVQTSSVSAATGKSSTCGTDKQFAFEADSLDSAVA
jgi:hypothetical protein